MKIRKAKNANKRLKQRQERYDALKTDDKQGRKRPGSTNPKKG